MAKYAFWSEEFVRRGHRTSVWSTPDGGEIEVCFVSSTPTAPQGWPDIKPQGEVVDWKRNGQRSFTPPPDKR